MAPLRLISFHLLLGWIALIVNADFNDEPGGPLTVRTATLGFSHEPDNVVVTRGQSARLDCLVRLPPPLTTTSSSSSGSGQQPSRHFDESIAFDVLWFQDGLPVHLPDQRRHLLANGSLYFEKVLHKRSVRNHSDEGVYHCLAKLKESSSSSGGGSFISRNGSIAVAALGREFTIGPDNVTVKEGDPARFGCEIQSLPEASISWEKDGVPIDSAVVTENESVNSSSRLVLLKSGVLHIYDVQLGDAGNYRCVARNELANKDRKSPIGRLEVIPASVEPPQLIFPSPREMWIAQGASVDLECLAPANAVVIWAFNSTVHLRATQPGYLSLTNVDASSAGNYTCIATAANVTVTRSTYVHVATLPEFIRVPKSQVFPTAKTVRFECEVIGSPAPEIRWLKDGRVLQIGGRIKNRIRGLVSELVLSNTVTTDSGVYQCQAQNRVGVVSVAARLLVNVSEGTRPEPPSNLRATALTPTIVWLTWDPPRNVPIGDVQAYTVHYMPLSGSTSEELQQVAINSSYRIDNLKRDTNYSFYVRAYVRKSASDPSDKLIFSPSSSSRPDHQPSTTRPTPKTLLPTLPSVTLVPLSPNTLRVTWRKFSSSVSFFKIQYRRHGRKDFDTEVVKGDVHEYTVTGLHPGRKYDVRVLPGTMNVASQWYTIEMPRVTTDATTSAVASILTAPAVELLTVNSTSVLITWEDMGPSSGHQPAQSMQLSYRIQGSRDSLPTVQLPPSGSRYITDLKPGSVYEFQMSSSSSGGRDHHQQESPITFTSIRTLWQSGIEHEEEDVDSEPRPIRMEAKALSSRVILVSWHPLPPETLANILYYTVRYVALAADDKDGKAVAPDIQFVRSTGHQVNLTNLTPYTVYRINVRSHDRQGRSSTYNSHGAEVRTLADLPGPPLDLSFTVSAGGMAQLTWKPPSPANGVVLGYVILISSDPDAPLDSWIRQEDDGSLLRSQFAGLVPGTMYYVRMQAKTSVGWGPLTAPLTFSFPFPAASSGYGQTEYLGTVIGLAVGIGLVVTCTMSVIFLRARCIKLVSSHRNAGSSSVIPATGACGEQPRAAGSVAVCNGFHHRHKQRSLESVRRNGGPPYVDHRDAGGSLVEMEAFVPMLSTILVEEPSHLDTKGGYQTGSRSSHREDSSLSNGSLRGVGGVRREQPQRRTISENDNGGGDDDDVNEADRSDLPLMSLQSNDLVHLNGTILSQATETTCLSLDYSGRHRRRRKHQHQQRQGSLHSHDSSLHSLDSRSSNSDSSSRSLRGQDDNDTGICHTDHQMNDSGLVVTVVGNSGGGSNSSNNNRSTPKGSRELVMIT